jgi:hypothetical protein
MTGVSSGDETENDVRVMKTDATRPADLEVFVRNGSVEPGERQTVFVQLVNTGNENAESVVVNLSAGRSPFRILDGPQRTQRVQAGGLAEVEFDRPPPSVLVEYPHMTRVSRNRYQCV